jgi:protoporphyrinogen oxidase
LEDLCKGVAKKLEDKSKVLDDKMVTMKKDTAELTTALESMFNKLAEDMGSSITELTRKQESNTTVIQVPGGPKSSYL